MIAFSNAISDPWAVTEIVSVMVIADEKGETGTTNIYNLYSSRYTVTHYCTY